MCTSMDTYSHTMLAYIPGICPINTLIVITHYKPPERSSEDDNEEEDDEKGAEFNKLSFQFRELAQQLDVNQVCCVSNLAAC